ncbi:magnesium chelatase ATPase subunit I, partial [Geitlerinema sp. P-1104]|nr:magnesium chelatase ATPase subunit I [Geitlerinema sp. P-1104]
KIVEERSQFDRNPQDYLSEHQETQQELQERLLQAQNLLGSVEISHELRVQISQVCAELDVDGLRGDIVTNRAAKALAAFEGRTEVTLDDIRRIITLCLRHRLRKDPMETIDSGTKVQKVFSEVFGVPLDDN